MNPRHLWRSSISAKIVLIVWAVSLLPLLILGIYGWFRLQSGHAQIAAEEYDALRRLALKQAHEVTTLNVGDVNHQLNEVERLLGVLQSEAESIYALPSPKEPGRKLTRNPEHHFFWTGAREGPIYFVSTAYTLSAELQDDLRRSRRLERTLRTLYEEQQGRLANVYYIANTGLALIYPNVDLSIMVERELLSPDMQFSDVPFFALAAPEHNPGKKIAWTQPYLDPLAKGWMVSGLAPVYRQDGTFEGVVGVDLTLQTLLTDLLAESSTYANQYTLLLDGQGTVIAAPASARKELGWPADVSPGEFNLLESERSVWGDALMPFLTMNLRETDARVALNQQIELPTGRRYLFIHQVPVTGWMLVTVLPESEITRQLQPMRESNRQTLRAIGRNFLLAVLLALAIAPLVGLALGRQFARPLRTFAQQVTTQTTGPGALQPVSINSGDEVGRLAHAFNGMVDELNARTRQIEEQQQTLEHRNGELTALNAVISSLHSSLDVRLVYETALQQSQQFLSCEYGVVYLLQDGELQVERAILPGAIKKERERRIEQKLSEEVLRQQTPVISTDLAQDPRVLIALEYEEGLQAYLGVPLQYAGMLYGVLAVLTRSPRVFSDREIALMQALGEQVGMAIANAQLYADLQRSYAELEEAQEEISRTQRLRAIGQLASGIAHDFNNMLTGIAGFTSLLLLDEQDAERRRMLMAIERTVGDGAALVSRMQEFGRVRRDQPRSSANLNAIIEEAVELTRPRWRDTAQANGIDIALNLELVQLPHIHGDPAGLREMLTNLILNALDAMPEGGSLLIATELQHDKILLKISDTGVGMPPDIRDHIFEPFFTTKGSRGQGLGLAMVEAIISHHGGAIDVSSSAGSGTAFSIELPLRISRPQQEPGPQPADIPPLRLLVIEDDPIVRKGLVQILRHFGHEVEQADDGKAALEIFRPKEYDVVITDLGMPKMSGWDIIRSIRSRDTNVRIVLLTGWGNQIEQQSILQLGGDALLSKPYTTDHLRALLAELVIQRRTVT